MYLSLCSEVVSNHEISHPKFWISCFPTYATRPDHLNVKTEASGYVSRHFCFLCRVTELLQQHPLPAICDYLFRIIAVYPQYVEARLIQPCPKDASYCGNKWSHFTWLGICHPQVCQTWKSPLFVSSGRCDFYTERTTAPSQEAATGSKYWPTNKISWTLGRWTS